MSEEGQQSPRDTQFAGFAELQFEELVETDAFDILDAHRFWREQDMAAVKLLLAQRAYDLVRHACEAIEDKETLWESRLTLDGMIEAVPDMAAHPKEE